MFGSEIIQAFIFFLTPLWQNLRHHCHRYFHHRYIFFKVYIQSLFLDVVKAWKLDLGSFLFFHWFH